MPRARTGTVEPRKCADGSVYFRARIRLADDSRERINIPDNYAVPAAEGGRWDVVAQLARKLEARRLAQSGNVFRLKAARKGDT